MEKVEKKKTPTRPPKKVRTPPNYTSNLPESIPGFWLVISLTTVLYVMS